MQTKTEKINAIFEKIFQNTFLDQPRINQIKNFIITTINGDEPDSWLVVNADSSEKNTDIIVYILTNLRLVKINIGQEIKSNSYFLNTITAIERKLLNDGNNEFGIMFQSGSLGLRYPAENQDITDFFQKIEQPRLINAQV